MPKPTSASSRRKRKGQPDYPLQGTKLDIPLERVLRYSPERREDYVNRLLDGFANVIRKGEFHLKRNVPFQTEMSEYRAILASAPDRFLFTDDKSRRNYVLGKGAPGASHIYWSLKNIWRMETKIGDLAEEIRTKRTPLVRKLNKLFDPKNESKAGFRNNSSAVLVALGFMQFDKGSGSAFPPFHARYLAHKFFPKNGDCLVVDPCAGWGGRLIGTLLVPRESHVHYVGIDPETANKPAYDGLTRRATIWLKKEIPGPRSSKLYYRPFEDWVRSKSAKKLLGKVDLVITSPPYFVAENYNPQNKKQSANRYPEYERWRDKFYEPLIKGAYDLLKPDGHFVLNVADVAEAPHLERDARKLATKAGFISAAFYKLALSMTPSTRKNKNARHMVSVGGNLFKYEPVFVFRKSIHQ